MDIYMAQMQDEPRKPSTLWPEVPPDLEAIILRCLRRAPSERFASAADLAVPRLLAAALPSGRADQGGEHGAGG